MLSVFGRRRVLSLLATLLPQFLFADDIVTVAVASNFSVTAEAIATAFTRESGVPVRISSGSTGKLYAQIINGAPFDVFLSADAERPLLLEQSGQIVAGSRRSYAIGAVVLWSHDERLRGEDCREVLQRGDYDWLALANPNTAPYGLAAREVLEAEGLWEHAARRAVFGENIAQTLNFVVTGNATLGFVAKSQTVNLALPAAACAWQVPGSLHTPLYQQVALLKQADNSASAQRFVEFLSTPTARKIIRKNGYTVPD